MVGKTDPLDYTFQEITGVSQLLGNRQTLDCFADALYVLAHRYQMLPIQK